jgi:hypothetical protein
MTINHLNINRFDPMPLYLGPKTNKTPTTAAEAIFALEVLRNHISRLRFERIDYSYLAPPASASKKADGRRGLPIATNRNWKKEPPPAPGIYVASTNYDSTRYRAWDGVNWSRAWKNSAEREKSIHCASPVQGAVRWMHKSEDLPPYIQITAQKKKGVACG